LLDSVRFIEEQEKLSTNPNFYQIKLLLLSSFFVFISSFFVFPLSFNPPILGGKGFLMDNLNVEWCKGLPYKDKKHQKLAAARHYQKNKELIKSRMKRRNVKYRQILRAYIADYLSKNPCIDCGETNPIVLEFDHRDTQEKTSTVSNLVRGRASLSKLTEEISKCDIRCANCHRKRTAVQFNWPSASNG